MKKLVLFLTLCAVANSFAQRNPNNNVVGVQQLDPRFTFSIEKRWSDIGDAESYYFYVKNNTADEYKLVIEVDLNLNCHESKPYKIGYLREVYLKPYGEFTPQDDYVHIYGVSDANEKKCLVTEGNTLTLYRSHTWQIVSDENLTLKKANEAKAKAEKEAQALQAKADAEKKRKEADAERVKKQEADKKAKADLAEAEKVKKQDAEKKAKADQAEAKKNDSSKKQTASSGTSDSKDEDTADEKSNKAKEDKEQKAAAAAEARERAEAERIAAEEKRRAEEEAANQKRQAEYESWRSAAQAENDRADAAAMASTLGIFTLLGGFIYEGMGTVDPYRVYRAPAKRFTPKMFIAVNIGFSLSGDPMLFQSNQSTMVNGKRQTTKSLIGETGYYLNVNAEAKIGAGNDFYNFYGLMGARFGLEPTFNGTQYALIYGGGIDVGIKNIKLFGEYRQPLINEKSLTSSDVEESGSAEYANSAQDIIYGVKFTFGGNADDNFRRSHISIGAINRTYNFDSGTQKYYDYESNAIRNSGNLLISGYGFEWKKEHTFSLFVKFFENYNYIGDASPNQTVGSSLRTPPSMFEVGFLRSIDFL